MKTSTKNAITSLGLGAAIILIGLDARAESKTTAKVTSLDQLLKRVKNGWRTETAEIKKREDRFLAAKGKREILLKKAQSTLASEQKRVEALEQQFEQNKIKITQLEQALKSRLGTMGELFGVIRQVAGDTRGQVKNSMVSAQFPGRADSLETLAMSKALPSMEQLQHLWYVIQHEMTESGKVVRFPAPVVTVDGEQKRYNVTRVGVFNAVANGRFLNWMPEMEKFAELGRQPAARFHKTAAEFERTTAGLATVAIDPSRGAVLSLLVQTPSFWERIQFGGLIGYIIICLGLVTLLLALARLTHLAVVSWRVQRQRVAAKPNSKNPLGRIIGIYEKNPGVQAETLERNLDEAILRESSRLDRFLWAIKIVAVVAPLMGLLGTVTGMIRTFQAITLFGTGDPKLMAGGISEALVTTMLGLCIAIPLVLLHSWLKSMSRKVVDVLEEQSAGIIARRMEHAVEHGGGMQ